VYNLGKEALIIVIINLSLCLPVIIIVSSSLQPLINSSIVGTCFREMPVVEAFEARSLSIGWLFSEIVGGDAGGEFSLKLDIELMKEKKQQ
jgi:hypothetical protein